ncbi:MAG: hypothetical protein ACYTXA_20480 [Nostoc sp.]
MIPIVRSNDFLVGAIPCGQLKLHELPLQYVVLRKFYHRGAIAITLNLAQLQKATSL